MSTTETPISGEEPKPEPESSNGESESSDRVQETWLDRLKAAVGLRPAPTIRQDLAEALASGDLVEGFSPEERAMLANILRLREMRVDDVMVPRADIEAVDIGTSLGDLFAKFQKSGHSRMPVYRGTLDEPVGFVHIKDLVSHVIESARSSTQSTDRRRRRLEGLDIDLHKVDLTKSLGDSDLVRNILFVPPSMPVTALLASMQGNRMQIALVIDEYGGTDGLVSLEDVVEMVVGDIEDEHDDDTGPMIVPEADGTFLADARADLDDVAEAIGGKLGANGEAEDVDTVGGLVFTLLGRVPVRGELIAIPGGFEFEILDADPRRIKRLRIYRRPEGTAKGEVRRRPKPLIDSSPAA